MSISTQAPQERKGPFKVIPESRLGVISNPTRIMNSIKIYSIKN